LIQYPVLFTFYNILSLLHEVQLFGVNEQLSHSWLHKKQIPVIGLSWANDVQLRQKGFPSSSGKQFEHHFGQDGQLEFLKRKYPS
jgi:hypothetical protein